jgi:hypothetical protein
MSPRLHVIVGGRPPYTITPGKPKSHVRVHPSAGDRPLLFDRTEHPDTATVPADVQRALDTVGHYVRVPGAIDRATALAALDVVAGWARPATDECDPHGMPRPS